MKSRSLNFFLFIIFFYLLLSCSRGGFKENEPPRDIYDRANDFYSKGKYMKAQAEFQRLIYSFPGQPFIDSAQYYSGMSLYNMGRYPESAGEFQRLLSAYPSSPLADDSQYQIGMCHYEQSPKYSLDQQETYAAIDEFTMLINRYPGSGLLDDARSRLNDLYEKLARKMFKNGELYMKLRDYDPALMYFGQVRDNYPQTEWAKRALFYSGVALFKLDRKSDALETFEDFVTAFPDHKLSPKARKYIDKIQSSEDGS